MWFLGMILKQTIRVILRVKPILKLQKMVNVLDLKKWVLNIYI